MQYTLEETIDLPREKVAELFVKPEHLKGWQKGFKSINYTKGETGETGSEAELVFEMGKREMKMKQEILENKLPDFIKFRFENRGVENIQVNRLETKDGKTHYVVDNTFNFSGIMKLMGWLMPGAFKKQSQKYMDDFKAYAESLK